MLAVGDFSAFFKEVHGYAPFPWQKRLVGEVCTEGKWRSVLDLPTSSGKTAAIDVAIFHLALEAGRNDARQAPVRIAFVVDRRLIVDDAYGRAMKLAAALETARPGTVVACVAERLKVLSGDGKPLLVRRLRGGIPREDGWVRSPSQPTVLCSTVDQVGSRLLFRGYGVSDSMKPVHAGLIGSDCLILLDEAHLAEPFRQTLHWISTYRDKKWREKDYIGPWGVSLLTATPGTALENAFQLSREDLEHPVLKRRLEASKPARLVCSTKQVRFEEKDQTKFKLKERRDDEEESDRIDTLVAEVCRAFMHFQEEDNGASLPAIGVVVNRVARARTVFERIGQVLRKEIENGRLATPILMIGPARPLDRDVLAAELNPIRTEVWHEGERRTLEKALIIVATQCIEAGVDIDLDALVTEAAPLDALRQRFGRLNRAGRQIVPYAAVVAARADVATAYIDPVYGKKIKSTWERLTDAAAVEVKGEQKVPVLDFGVNSFAIPADPGVLSDKIDAPVLLPAHIDLLSQTAPIPAASPDISLYLHGAERPSDSVMVVWRADLGPDTSEEEGARTLLKLVPPRPAEAIELPLWAVRRWLESDHRAASANLADVAAQAPADDVRESSRRKTPSVFRWKGDDDQSRWIWPSEICTGDTIIVPASYGGVDAFGWNPVCRLAAVDLGRKAAEPFAAQQWAIRIAPGLFKRAVTDALPPVLVGVQTQGWMEVREAVRSVVLPEDILSDLRLLDVARRGSVTYDMDLYGRDENGRPRGVVFIAPFGVKHEGMKVQDAWQSTTENDIAGSLPGFFCSLSRHSADVQRRASIFAESAGFPSDRIIDFKVAGFLHDAGKADWRFQAWLHHDDPFGGGVDEPAQLLAKSGRPLPRAARRASGLPARWRHEALSVRLAIVTETLFSARDPELVLWLIGTHHGYGRPFFPHADSADGEMRNVPFIDGRQVQLAAGHGPQSPAFDWQGADWAELFDRLKARYGVWELARMEATLRLADHRASHDAAPQNTKRDR